MKRIASILAISGLFSLLFLHAVHASTILQPTSYLGNQTSLNRGLVGYWSFNNQDMNWATGKALDRSGQGNDGSLINFSTTTSSVMGKTGQALNFNGISSVINTSSNPIGTGLVTVCAWAKFNGSIGVGVVKSIVDTVYFEMQLYNDGTGYVLLVTSDNSTTVASGYISNINTWNHYCVIRQASGQVTLFVNSLSSGSGNSGTPNSGFNLSIGADGTNSRFYFSGLIDGVRIYNRALSVSEIHQLYLQGAQSVEGTTGGGSRGCALSALNCNLVGYWTFNNQDMNWTSGRVNDLSGNANNGNVMNMATSTSPVAGRLGQALKFGGVNSAVVIPHNSTLKPSSQITISAWVKPNVGSLNALKEIYRKEDLSGRHLLSFQDSANCNNGGGTGGCLSFGLHTGGTYLELDVNIAASDYEGKWSLVTATYDGVNKKIYKNGVLIGTAATSGSIGTAGSANLYIGSSQGTLEFFSGLIDEVRVYSRALSAAEVGRLYLNGGQTLEGTSGGAATGRGCGLSSLNCGLTGYWSFNNQDMNWASGKAFDKSGQGNDGLILSMSTTTSPVAGKFGQALTFDSTKQNQEVSITGSTQYALVNAPFTVSAWTKFGNFNSSVVPVLISLKSDGGASLFLDFSNVASFLGVSAGSASTWTSVKTGTPTSGLVGAWHHIVYEYNGQGASTVGNFQIYIDNVNQTLSSAGSYGSGGNTTVIGGTPNLDSSTLWDGAIDDVRIYNRQLSSTEIRQLYLLGK